MFNFLKQTNNKKFFYKKGFTLIELLVVIAIMGMLSSVILGSLNVTRERAKAITAVQMIRNMQKIVATYDLDVGNYPANCDISFCNSSNDPFLNKVSDGFTGWKGPYMTVWNKTHPWGGHFGYMSIFSGESNDLDGDGIPDYAIILNDDRFGTNESDNNGRISNEAMVLIDKTLDDGNLSTGNVRGNGGSWPYINSSIGELIIKASAN